jgi:hypothetical protein
MRGRHYPCFRKATSFAQLSARIPWITCKDFEKAGFMVYKKTLDMEKIIKQGMFFS